MQHALRVSLIMYNCNMKLKFNKKNIYLTNLKYSIGILFDRIA